MRGRAAEADPGRGGRGLRGARASARIRILGWVVLLLALAGAAALLLQRRVLLERLDDEVERALVQEAEEVRVLAAGRDPATGQPFGANVSAIFDTFLRRNIPGEGEAWWRSSTAGRTRPARRRPTRSVRTAGSSGDGPV